VNKKRIIIGVIALVLVSGFYYRFTHLATGTGEEKAHNETAEPKEKNGAKNEGGEDEAPKTVSMTPEIQKQHGVVVAAAKQERLADAIKRRLEQYEQRIEYHAYGKYLNCVHRRKEDQ